MRLAGRIKMAYYPTPTAVVERIKTFIRIPDHASIFDPCCGEGNALKQLVEGSSAKTYGIEIDRCRAEEAAAKLDRVLGCGIEQGRISNGAFSLLFLNPPYDWETGEQGDERKEKSFIRETVRYLQPGGVLVYIIPQRRLDKNTAKIVGYRFEKIQAFRFPRGEYEAYKQIVLFGVKKKKPELEEKILGWLARIRSAEVEELPVLEQPEYDLPQSKPISLFQSGIIDENVLEKEVRESGLWKRFGEMTRVEEQRMGRPPLPLHTGHLGLLLANGCLDGIVGCGEDRHVVRGKVEKTTAKFTEQKGDIIEERELDQYKVTIKILRQDGEIITLM